MQVVVFHGVEVGGGEQPGVGDHHQVLHLGMGGEETCDDGDEGLRLGGVSGEHVDVQGEAVGVDEEADLDLGIHPVFFGAAHPARFGGDGQAALVDICLEVQSGRAITSPVSGGPCDWRG